MWFDVDTRAAVFKSFLSALWVFGMFYSSGAYATASGFANAAGNAPNLATMLTNFATAVPNLMRMVTAGAYVMGMYFVMAGVMGMKHFGEMRTMMSQEHGVTGPLVEVFIGAAMLYLPSTIRTGLSTFWVSTEPYAYLTGATDQYTTFINACYSIIQLIGVVAFIRGLMILQKVGSGKGQQDTLGKAIAHIGGGVLCINMYNTIQMLEATVGWNS